MAEIAVGMGISKQLIRSHFLAKTTPPDRVKKIAAAANIPMAEVEQLERMLLVNALMPLPAATAPPTHAMVAESSTAYGESMAEIKKQNSLLKARVAELLAENALLKKELKKHQKIKK